MTTTTVSYSPNVSWEDYPGIPEGANEYEIERINLHYRGAHSAAANVIQQAAKIIQTLEKGQHPFMNPGASGPIGSQVEQLYDHLARLQVYCETTRLAFARHATKETQ